MGIAENLASQKGDNYCNPSATLWSSVETNLTYVDLNSNHVGLTCRTSTSFLAPAPLGRNQSDLRRFELKSCRVNVPNKHFLFGACAFRVPNSTSRSQHKVLLELYFKVCCYP